MVERYPGLIREVDRRVADVQRNPGKPYGWPVLDRVIDEAVARYLEDEAATKTLTGSVFGKDENPTDGRSKDDGR